MYIYVCGHVLIVLSNQSEKFSPKMIKFKNQYHPTKVHHNKPSNMKTK